MSNEQEAVISHIYFRARQGAKKKDLKMVRCFSGQSDWVIKTEGPGVGVALGKFDSSDLNERFWQT